MEQPNETNQPRAAANQERRAKVAAMLEAGFEVVGFIVWPDARDPNHEQKSIEAWKDFDALGEAHGWESLKALPPTDVQAAKQRLDFMRRGAYVFYARKDPTGKNSTRRVR